MYACIAVILLTEKCGKPQEQYDEKRLHELNIDTICKKAPKIYVIRKP